MTIKQIVIESGVEMGNIVHSGRYPFEAMKVGDSIKFDKRDAARAGAERASTRFSPKRFVFGQDKLGHYRVWRTE